MLRAGMSAYSHQFSRLNHLCLVELVGFSLISPPAMVLELITGGDLYEFLHVCALIVHLFIYLFIY
jgi:hypothetical protein